MTATSPVVCSTQSHRATTFGTGIGKPILAWQVKLGDKGCALLSGRRSAGYWNLPDADQRDVYTERWLNTGESARYATRGFM